jgi:amino acid adenylation domain-containing protein
LTPQQFLKHLGSLGISLSAEDGKLRVRSVPGRLTAELKSAILEHKPALLEILTREAMPVDAPIVPLDPDSRRNASDFQQRLWILQRIDRSSTGSNLARVWWTTGIPGVAGTLSAIQRLIARHAILRSSFQEDAGTVFAVAGDNNQVPIDVRDLSALGLEEQRKRIRADLGSEAKRAFDLVAAPPVRFIVYDLGAQSPAVLLIAHHIAVDAWSMGLIGRELLSSHADPEHSAPPLLQFHDFVAWQRAVTDPRQVAADIEWWASYLEGAPAVSAFPKDGPGGDASGSMHTVVWDASFAAQLKSTAGRLGATLFMSMLAACAAVLRWHTGQTDLVFGIPMGVRERTESESMIGPFVNLLLVRMDVSGDPDFAELLHRARDAILEAHAHRSAPFELLLERLHPARSLDRAPLFQVALVQHQAAGVGSKTGDDMDAEQATGGSTHELTWFMTETADSIACAFEYRADLYSPTYIKRVADHLELVLRRGALDSGTRVSQLCTPAEGERRMLINDLNATRTESVTPFLRRFEGWAVSIPDRVAIACQGREISYRELNARAEAIAHLLRSRGSGPGKLVAVLLPRDPELVAALLAVLKCGAAYLPLDPQFPVDRIRFMLEDSGTDLVLVSGGPPNGLQLTPSVSLLDLQLKGAAGSPPADMTHEQASGDEPAYVIYTSGSTGQPKGTVIARRSLDNLLNAMSREPGLTQQDLLAAVTTISFDIAGLELFLPLFVGAQLELVARETASDGRRLSQLLSSRPITVMQATPATWWMLVDSGWTAGPGFRAWCGGESLAPDLADTLLDRVKELWNLYGPTETTIWSTRARIAHGHTITVGKPIDNTQIYILGPSCELMPFGIAGEIVIGGDGVALGYHNRHALTAERFVDDRFTESGGKLYRTGDLGRWREDGSLEHLGRSDQQVKIRGFRIELDEVEAALRALPEVERAVAMAADAGRADRRLVAYLQFRPGEDLTASEVRRQLRKRLPDFMVPSIILTIDSVPLTANGKVDRKALPDPFNSVSARREFEAPAEGMERLLAGVWKDVLKIEQVSANDNFFDLGGHSLLSLKVASAVEQKSGWSMDPRILFFNSLRQIASMARIMEATAAEPLAGSH